MPEFYSFDHYYKNPPTKKLFDFFQQEDGAEFAYSILNTN
jgi:hypothetical protein